MLDTLLALGRLRCYLPWEVVDRTGGLHPQEEEKAEALSWGEPSPEEAEEAQAVVA